MRFALLKKDWRVNRAAVIGGLALLLIPYALAASDLASRDSHSEWRVSWFLIAGASGGLALNAVTAAVFGGTAFAAERRDRSAEFMAMLPLSRLRAVGGKLWAAITFLSAAWIVHACCIAVALFYQSDYGYYRPYERVMELVWNTASITVMAFGMAWLLSSVVSSPALAAGSALALTAVTLAVTIDLARPQEDAIGLLGALQFLFDSGRFSASHVGALSLNGLARLVLWCFGIGAWVAGTTVFVRRVAP